MNGLNFYRILGAILGIVVKVDGSAADVFARVASHNTNTESNFAIE
jgi:hypothetical protein